MIERISLGRKLVVLLGLPLVNLLLLVALAMADRWSQYQAMREVATNTRPAFVVSELTRQMLKERVLTYMALSDAGNPRWSTELAAQHPVTDDAREPFDALFEDESRYSDEIREHLRAARSAANDLDALRTGARTGALEPDAAIERYGRIVQDLNNVVGVAVDRCDDVEVKQQLLAVFLLQHVMYYAGLERGYVQGVLADGTLDAGGLQKIVRADESRERYAETFEDLMDDALVTKFEGASRGRATLDPTVLALETAAQGVPLAIDAGTWWADSFTDIENTRELQEEINALAAETVDERLDALWRELLLYAGSGAGISFLVVVVGWSLSRSISISLVTTGERSQAVAQTIVSAVQQLSSATNETATMVAQTSTTVDEIRKTSEAAAQRAQEVADGAGRSRVASNDTRDAVRRGSEAMQNIRQEVEGIAQTIVDLSSRTIQISEIVQSVGAIAEQSNLLAVNASIEAAKAGEYGRGFSVVASEVKALAQQSKDATDRIRQILAEIQKSSNAAVMITEQGVKRVEEGADLISEMGRGVEELANVIAHSADAANQILLTAREQVVGVEEIAQAMQSIEQATKENAAGAHQLESAATTVRAVSVQLGDIVHGRAA